MKVHTGRTEDEKISPQTLATVCRDILGTSKNHALRHTFTVEMKRAGAAITDIADALGHTDIKITQRYMVEVDRGNDNPYGDKLVTRFGIRRKEK